jgi:CheY-like chemotaxis protein
LLVGSIPPATSIARRAGVVLIVDDYADSRGAVRELLEDNGYEVVESSNGQEALNFLVSGAVTNVQLIVLDLQMPIMNGWQFLTLLENYVRLSTIPVVVVSAHPALPNQGMHKSIVGCLKVPYQTDELLGLVNGCCTPTKVPSPNDAISLPFEEQASAVPGTADTDAHSLVAIDNTQE